MSGFLTKNDNQFCFIKGKRTSDALSFMTPSIFSAIFNNKFVIGTIVDLKNYKNGIRGKKHKMIKSYLSDRNQIVRLNELYGDTVSTGAPQGTILGSLLFVLYVNDIF